ncbi:DUF1844 domain-containing protein [Rubripirellula sp.]|jgi:hypothetical protein|nr:DUF1844 domain-containing protein [Rubripirellula sp.]
MSDHDKIDDEASNDETEATIKVDGDEKNSDQSPSDVSDSSSEPSTDSMPEPPPASFSVLVTMLFTQAMGMLGQMPDPNTGEAKVNKPFAKHYIDTLEMLESKTKGNLDDQEAAMLNEALHALRMMYVDTRDA